MVSKTVLGALSAIIAAPFVLALVVPPLLDGDSLSPLLEKELGNLLGHPVRIGGNTLFRLLPSPSLTADFLDILDPGDDQTIPSATIRKAKVELPLFPLLQGRLEVQSLQLDSFDLRGLPSISSLTAQQGVTGDIQGKLNLAGITLDFSARFAQGNQITITDSHGAVLNFSGSISEHGVELAGPVELTMPAPNRSLARFGGFLPTQPLKVNAQLVVDQGQVNISNLAALLGDAAIVGNMEMTSAPDRVLKARLTTNGLNMDQWEFVVPLTNVARAALPTTTLSAILPPEGSTHSPSLLPQMQLALVNESFVLGGKVWPAARLLLDTEEERVLLRLAEVDVPGGRVQIAGQGAIVGETYFDGTMTVSTRDSKVFGDWLGLDPVDFSMTVPILWIRQGLNLTPMTGQWNATPLYGGLTLVPQDFAQILVVDIKTEHGDFGLQSRIRLGSDRVLNLDDFIVQIGRYSAQGAVQAGWEAGKPRFAALLNTPLVPNPVVAGQTKAETSASSSPSPPVFVGLGDGRRLAALIQIFAAAIEVPVGNSTIDWQGPDLPLGEGVVLSQPRARLVWQNGQVNLDSLSGRWGEGTVEFKGAVIRDTKAEGGVRLEAYGRINDADVSALKIALGPISLAAGKFEAEGNLSTYGRTPNHWLGGLEGMIRFDSTDGHLRGINLPALVVATKTSGVSGLLRMSRKSLLSGITPFQSLKGTAVVEGPQISTDDLMLRTESGSVGVISSVNLQQETIDSTITLQFSGLEPLRFYVDGPLDHPKIVSDPDLLKRKVVR